MRHSSFILLTACGLAASLAQAQTPTITFEGEVTDQTCKATINGQTDAVVMLPTVRTSEFAAANATAGPTSFTLDISGCTAVTTGTREVKVKFLGRNVTASGNLGNTNPGNGVSVQLVDGNDTLDLSTGIVERKVGDLSGSATSLSKDFTARYVSETDTVTPGKVTAVVEYTLSYL